MEQSPGLAGSAAHPGALLGVAEQRLGLEGDLDHLSGHLPGLCGMALGQPLLVEASQRDKLRPDVDTGSEDSFHSGWF